MPLFLTILSQFSMSVPTFYNNYSNGLTACVNAFEFLNKNKDFITEHKLSVGSNTLDELLERVNKTFSDYILSYSIIERQIFDQMVFAITTFQNSVQILLMKNYANNEEKKNLLIL